MVSELKQLLDDIVSDNETSRTSALERLRAIVEHTARPWIDDPCSDGGSYTREQLGNLANVSISRDDMSKIVEAVMESFAHFHESGAPFVLNDAPPEMALEPLLRYVSLTWREIGVLALAQCLITISRLMHYDGNKSNTDIYEILRRLDYMALLRVIACELNNINDIGHRSAEATAEVAYAAQGPNEINFMREQLANALGQAKRDLERFERSL